MWEGEESLTPLVFSSPAVRAITGLYCIYHEKPSRKCEHALSKTRSFDSNGPINRRLPSASQLSVVWLFSAPPLAPPVIWSINRVLCSLSPRHPSPLRHVLLPCVNFFLVLFMGIAISWPLGRAKKPGLAINLRHEFWIFWGRSFSLGIVWYYEAYLIVWEQVIWWQTKLTIKWSDYF